MDIGRLVNLQFVFDFGGILLGLSAIITAAVSYVRWHKTDEAAKDIRSHEAYMSQAAEAVRVMESTYNDYQERMQREMEKLEGALTKERVEHYGCQSEVIGLRGEIAGLKVEIARQARELTLMQAQMTTELRRREP